MANFPDNDTCFDDDRCDGAGNCRRGNGDPCDVNSDCRFGNCVREPGDVDGVCCNSACTDICDSCRAADTDFPDGSCEAIRADTDPYGECATLPGRLCRNGTCAADIGDPCNASLPCGTNAGVCLSGFCCNSTQCGEFSGSACNSCANAETGAPNGTCAPVLPGPDPYGQCPSGQCAEGGSCVP